TFWQSRRPESDFQYRRSANRIVPQRAQRVVSFLQPELAYFGVDRNGRGDFEKILTIVPGIVGDAADDALVVQQVVIHLWDRAHMNATQRHRRATFERAQRGEDQFARRSEDQVAIENSRRLLVGSSGPDGAQVHGEFPVARVASHGIYLDSPVARHLNRHMRGRTETVHTEPAAALHTRQPQRAEADNAGAQQGRDV